MKRFLELYRLLWMSVTAAWTGAAAMLAALLVPVPALAAAGGVGVLCGITGYRSSPRLTRSPVSSRCTVWAAFFGLGLAITLAGTAAALGAGAALAAAAAAALAALPWAWPRLSAFFTGQAPTPADAGSSVDGTERVEPANPVEPTNPVEPGSVRPVRRADESGAATHDVDVLPAAEPACEPEPRLPEVTRSRWRSWASPGRVDVEKPGRDRPDPPRFSARLVTPEGLAELSDDAVCFAWRCSYVRLRRARTDAQRLEIVGARAAYLDELERRHSAGFAAWIASGARAAGDPTRYVCGRPPRPERQDEDSAA